MCEVTRRNFESKFPEIVRDLQSASFISIDCEFTGLTGGISRCSLFDTAEVRFNKLQKALKDILIIQLGLSTFKLEKESNAYTASSYTFYLVPTGFSLHSPFVCEGKSIEFLCKHKFDFNKLFYEGLSYLKKSDEAELVRLIEEGGLLEGDNVKEIQKYCSRIAKWNNDLKSGSEMLLELSEGDAFMYILHEEVRKRFPNLWTFVREPNVVRVRKVAPVERMRLMDKNESVLLRKKLFDSILGFSRILRVIETLKIPIVGHNFLSDLILIYQQFYNSSPVTYKEFKKRITEIFPCLYDTKRVSFQLRDMLSREQSWSSNNLSELYQYLKTGKGSTLALFSPLVYHRNEEYLEEKCFHDAGFDSYCTGFCFLKMAHIFALWDKGKKACVVCKKPNYNFWILTGMKPMKNQVNLVRAQVNYMALDQEDPRSTRPSLLLVSSKTNSPLNFSKMSERLSGKYGSFDIQPVSKWSGIMAITNQKQFEEILAQLRGNREIEVTHYSFFKHSTAGRVLASSSIVASVILLAVGMQWVGMKASILNPFRRL